MNSFAAGMSRHFLVIFLLLLGAISGQGQAFTVTATPQSITVHPGDKNVPVTVSVASSTYTGPVNVTLSGLPTGITVSPAPLTLQPGGTGTIMLNVGLNADQEAFPASSPGNADSATTTVTVLGAVGSATAKSTVSLTVSLSNPSFAPGQAQINLPVMTINTGGTPIKDGTTDVPGTITITSADGSTSYLPNSSDPDNTASFHWHGNTTSQMPKKSYHVKLNTSLDLLQQMGLNCPYLSSKGKPTCDKSKSYVLLANYDDKTLLRDWAASALANAIPYGGSYLDETPLPSGSTGVIPTPSGTSTHMPWAPHSLYVELYLNGTYEGNYQLVEQVKVDGNRVNVPELAETDTGGSGDDITGGYLLEIDHHMDSAFVFTTPQNLPIGLIDPDFTPDPEVPEQTSYINDYVNAAETALFSSSFTDPKTGWRAYYDEASAVNFYLVNDIMGNVDGGDFFSSDYFYKTKDNPFLYMGPVWDFDISSGNVNYETIENPTVPWASHSLWYKQWFLDPGFKADVTTQFNTLKKNGVLSDWVASISQQAATLEQSQVNNFSRWPMVGIKVWPNPQAAGSYDGEVAYLTNYVNLRIAYLDSLFNGKAQTATTITVPSGTLYLGSPVTLQAHVTGATTPTGIVTFFSAQAAIGTAPLDGTGTASLTTTKLLLGTNTTAAVYNGDSRYALSSSTKQSLTVVQPLAGTSTSLAVSTANVSPSATVMLSVSVTGNSGTTTPSGSVKFLLNGGVIGSATLTNGAATYAAANFPAGSDTLQAVYSGDSLYQISTSPTVPVTVTGGSVSVTVGTSPNGLAYTVDGVSYSSGQTLSLAPGTTHTLATASPQVSSGQQNVFAGWSDGGALSHTITVPKTATSYTAKFNTLYLLTASASPSGSGTVGVSSPGSNGYYPTGTVVTLTAAPAAGYVFSGWTGNVANPNSATTTVTMTAAQTVSAKFTSSGGGIGYGGGFTATDLTMNGSATLTGSQLQLTNSGKQAGSAYASTAVSVQSFTSDFTFQLKVPTSDGMTFVLQNQGLSALGAYGQDLGYGSGSAGIKKSVAVKFDLYNNSGEGADSTGLFTNGTRPTVPATDLTTSNVDLHSGSVFHAHLSYNGTTLVVTITDTTTGATATQNYTVNIPSIVGGNTAYAGFTAGTGSTSASQKILTWVYTPAASGTVVPSPTFSPLGGNYLTAQPVTLKDATPGSSIYYTLDGTTPTTKSTLYSSSSPITVSTTTTVTAMATLNGTNSAVSSATYAISTGGVGFGNGFTAAGLTLNGSASLNGTQLLLTSKSMQASSAYSSGAVDVQSFTNDFTLQLTKANADGMTFVLQNQGLSAVGADGMDLGYGSGSAAIKKSVAVKFDLYNNSGEGGNSTGLFSNGTRPTNPAIDLTPSGVNLHSGNILHVHMVYNGSTLVVTITDTVTQATATQSYTVDIPSLVGAKTAYVGFTAGTGGAYATQSVLTWTYTTP